MQLWLPLPTNNWTKDPTKSKTILQSKQIMNERLTSWSTNVLTERRMNVSIKRSKKLRELLLRLEKRLKRTPILAWINLTWTLISNSILKLINYTLRNPSVNTNQVRRISIELERRNLTQTTESLRRSTRLSQLLRVKWETVKLSCPESNYRKSMLDPRKSTSRTYLSKVLQLGHSISPTI